MTFATIDALRESLAQPLEKIRTPEYNKKMIHDVPRSTVVDRISFIANLCVGKRVLDIGATGILHAQLCEVALAVWGLDRTACGVAVTAIDLDDVIRQDLGLDFLNLLDEGPEVIVCGEVLEHLSNPGWFLTRLRRQFPGVPVIVTVPNAFTVTGMQHMLKGVENVNIDHVAWYSHRTLKTLLERHGYAIETFHWYNGDPRVAEGLIVVTR